MFVYGLKMVQNSESGKGWTMGKECDQPVLGNCNCLCIMMGKRLAR